jgi:hypothetical protein
MSPKQEAWRRKSRRQPEVIRVEDLTRRKVELLEGLYGRHGDFELFHMDGIRGGSTRWRRWKRYSECSDEERRQANLRSVLRPEIVLDLDEPGQLEEVLKKLNSSSLSYSVWSTGSRGQHVHLLFDELEELAPDDRQRVKAAFIRQYGGDPAKKAERNLIAIENAPHFKTGKPKTCILRMHAGENELPAEVLDESRTRRISCVSVESTVGREWVENDPVLNYALNNRIPEHHRRDRTLFKNLAIGLVQSGVSAVEMAFLVDEIVSNCPAKTKAELWSWINMAREGRIRTYNKRELNRWIEEFGLPIDGYRTSGCGESRGVRQSLCAGSTGSGTVCARTPSTGLAQSALPERQ